MQARGGGRRVIVTLGVVLLVVLGTAVGTAADRLDRPPGGTFAIAPSYTLLPYADPAPQAALPISHAVSPPALAVPAKPLCPETPAVPATPSAGAFARGPRLTVRDRPDGAVVRTLANPTDEGQRLNVLVVGRAGPWLRVQLPVRPNHTTGWVRAADVAPYETPYRILVELCARRLTVFKLGTAVWSRPVAVGAPRTPTPRGAFYIDFVTTMRAGGAYGPYLLSVAGFSDVLHQFGDGGIGQIALHGTNRPASIGTAASHGCVRLHNAALRELVTIVPAGTAVTIVA